MRREVGGTNCTFGKLESSQLCRITRLLGYEVGRVEVAFGRAVYKDPAVIAIQTRMTRAHYI